MYSVELFTFGYCLPSCKPFLYVFACANSFYLNCTCVEPWVDMGGAVRLAPVRLARTDQIGLVSGRDKKSPNSKKNLMIVFFYYSIFT